jgi:hypothetical protein
MGLAADGIEEWKKLGTKGKLAVGGGFLVVALLGFYEYRKKQSGQTASSAAGVPAASNQGGIAGLSALDTQSLAQQIAGFVNARQSPGSPSNALGTSNTNGSSDTNQPTIPPPVFRPGPGNLQTAIPGNMPAPPGGTKPAIIQQKGTKVPVSSLPIGRNGPQSGPISITQSGPVRQPVGAGQWGSKQIQTTLSQDQFTGLSTSKGTPGVKSGGGRNLQ